jgi:tetratricopeptide (TPR) repeat protein
MNVRGKCFVIMGYGVKTDPTTGRELNLDKTYKNIIKPAVKEANLECIRADEIKHSGTIDVPMYKHLLESDVVIADLSTYNANAFYELGVRHALRPKTTIAIAESELQPPFDVNHTVIHQYEHLGKDIGCDEAVRFRKELVDTINMILDSGEYIDSPVYTYIKDLKPPIFDSINVDNIDDKKQMETLGSIIEKATDALNKDDFMLAKALFEHARSIDFNNEYIIQKLALSTYKSKYPSHVEALKEALSVLEVLKLEKTTDPETLGLAGAIYKRLWEEQDCIASLNKAILFYEKGFYIKNDYYNGVNIAYLLNVRGSIAENQYEAIADYTVANRIRTKVIEICENLYNDNHFSERSDKYWIVATLEESYFALDLSEKYTKMKEVSKSLSKGNWERETTEQQISKLKALLDGSPLRQ